MRQMSATGVAELAGKSALLEHFDGQKSALDCSCLTIGLTPRPYVAALAAIFRTQGASQRHWFCRQEILKFDWRLPRQRHLSAIKLALEAPCK